GRAGVDACLADPPDLALVDLNLPGRHGLDIVRDLRQHTPATRILVLTGHAEPKLPPQLMGLGVAGLVAKTAPLASGLRAVDTRMSGGRFFVPEGAGGV